MELEKIATNAVETSIVKTDRLTSFISRGDKEPCWDGNVYIHESKLHNKKNIRKVSTQVKGKAVTHDQVCDTIKYRISRDDLTAYMMNGGALFFVVYIDKITRDPLQIYYTELLPIKIKDILKKDQNSFNVRFVKFPDDNTAKTIVFEKFYEDAQRQASFAGKDIPSVDDLSKQGLLEGLTFHCMGVGSDCSLKAVPRMMNGKSLSIYANVKGYSLPIPVEFYENVQQVTMCAQNDTPITVNGTQYYGGFTEVTTADRIELHIGSCVKVILPNVGKEESHARLTITIKINGTLKQQIAGINFVSAMISHKKFFIGAIGIPVFFSDTELKKIGVYSFHEVLTEYKRIQAFLDSMNVKKDFDIHKCDDNDFRKLNLLIQTIRDKRFVRGEPEGTASVQGLTIANLKLAVVYMKRERGGYYIFDYFGKHFDVTYAPDDAAPVSVSQFYLMGMDDFLIFDKVQFTRDYTG